MEENFNLQSGGCSTSLRLDYVNDTKLPKMKLLNQTSPSLPCTTSQLKNTYLGIIFACVLEHGNGKQEMGNGKSRGEAVTSHDFSRAYQGFGGI